MFKNILFVCVGNICRSPTAEYWARHELQKMGMWECNISSAGIGALEHSSIAPEAKIILDRYKIDTSAHRAKQIRNKDVAGAEIILTMEDWQTEKLSLAFPHGRGKIFCLGKWAGVEIGDPYRKDQNFFEKTFDAIKDNWTEWQIRLWKT